MQSAHEEGTREKNTLAAGRAFGMVVMVAVTAAGCGGTQSSSGTSTAAAVETSSSATAAHTSTASHTSTVTAREKAVKFSECMRANGVSDFPDPERVGRVPFLWGQYEPRRVEEGRRRV